MIEPGKDPTYFRYWGKTFPTQSGSRFHQLAFHSLDVAACAQVLTELPRFGLKHVDGGLGWPPERFRQVFTTMMAFHDCGKFARAFQGLAPGLNGRLVPPIDRFRYTTEARHDTLGWLLLVSLHAQEDGFVASRLAGWQGFWYGMFRVATGHHGHPPRESTGFSGLRLESFFAEEDVTAAATFIKDAGELLLPAEIPTTGREASKILARVSWALAGLAVLADWLGSNASYFLPCEEPRSLSEYWNEVALPAARRAVADAGLNDAPVATWQGPSTMFDFAELTPLQRSASEVELAEGPQLFLLEDVTGSGKTEAALLLCHRLMAEGKGSGFYFALPTMATANQLHARIKKVYRSFFAGGRPSLVLSHGARDMVAGFRESILLPMAAMREGDLGSIAGTAESSGTAECSAWLADSRKKSTLADIGVGTIDQALLAVLPVRHQSLRWLGLASKVLVLDEVHAYDAYTSTLLQKLVEAHTMSGGSTILLSATVPSTLRAGLIESFYRGFPEQVDAIGRTVPLPDIEPDLRYPLVTHVAQGRSPVSHSCETRANSRRSVAIETLHSFEAVAKEVLHMAANGSSVCWIRNTVEDARDALRALNQSLSSERITLFHARFTMQDRLRIEGNVLGRFGKDSTPELRRSQVLIATQVVEQSLDLDFDELISDLAPIDLLIQRAGRLRRHVRSAEGRRLPEGEHDGRGDPLLHVFAPEFVEEPSEVWYKATFPRAAAVYEDTAVLWRTLKAMRAAKHLVSPEGVRPLVEMVYDPMAEVPDGLLRVSGRATGVRLAQQSQADGNSLKLGLGYCVESNNAWYDRSEILTRRGDESQTVYLAVERDRALAPFAEGRQFAWELSAVKVRMGVLGALAPEWEARFGGQLAELRKSVPLLDAEEDLILPVIPDGRDWIARCLCKGRLQTVRYSRVLGLLTEDKAHGADGTA